MLLLHTRELEFGTKAPEINTAGVLQEMEARLPVRMKCSRCPGGEGSQDTNSIKSTNGREGYVPEEEEVRPNNYMY